MKKTKKVPPTHRVFVSSSDRYDLPINTYGKLCFSLEEFSKDPKSFRLVVLTGGEDISPSLYGQKQSDKCKWVNVKRDMKDYFVAHLAIMHNIPIVGICRGAQLLNVISGGSLIQDCDNHVCWHMIKTHEQKDIWVSSTHHQLMIPSDEDTYILAEASPKRITKCFGENGEVQLPEIEADTLLFYGINAIGFQYHPEYMNKHSDAIQFFHECIQTYLVEEAPQDQWDRFISLPKPEITEETIKAETDLLASLSDKQKQKYLAVKERDETIAYWKRDYMASLWSEAEAEKQAISDYKEMMKSIRESMKEAKEAEEEKTNG